MKTVAIFEEIPESGYFFLFDGDKRHLHDVFINEEASEREDELMSLVFSGNDGEITADKLTREEAEKAVRDGAFLIRCGFMM